jgi:hypothetical protein
MIYYLGCAGFIKAPDARAGSSASAAGCVIKGDSSLLAEWFDLKVGWNEDGGSRRPHLRREMVEGIEYHLPVLGRNRESDLTSLVV